MGKHAGDDGDKKTSGDSDSPGGSGGGRRGAEKTDDHKGDGQQQK